MWENCCGKALFYLRDGVGGEIAEVRNGIVDAVLEYDRKANAVSHLFWIDDDVLVFPGCLLELLHLDTDIASGVYFTKLPDSLASPLVYSERLGGADRFRPGDIYPVWGHGMGLTLVRTSVYRRMRDELRLPQDKYGRPSWYHTTRVSDEVTQDETGLVHTGYTEDLWFLENASKLGYRPVIDGTKHAFGFHYDAAKDRGYPTEQWEQWIRGEPIRWRTPGGVIVWD
jgi:hypothetical protein